MFILTGDMMKKMKKGIFIQAGLLSGISYILFFLIAISVGEFNSKGMFILPSIIAIFVFLLISILFWRRPEIIFPEQR